MARVPGPYLYKLTSSISLYYTISGKVHYWLHELHLEYGPIVQYGPNNVSIITKEGVNEIHSTYRFKKPELYDAFEFGGPNVGTIRDRVKHTDRKRMLFKLFNISNLESLEDLVNAVGIKPILKKLDKIAQKNETLDIFKLILDFYFDTTGMFTVGKRFNLITNGSHPVTSWMKEAHKFAIINYKLPWIKYFGNWFGKAGYDSAIKFSQERLRERKQNLSKKQYRDFSDLFLNEEASDLTITDGEICGEITIQFIAGIDAPGSSLTWLIKLLIQYPEKMKRLQQEVDGVFPDLDEKITYKKVRSQCPYLEAVIYETFRLFPIAGGTTPRLVPEEGYTFLGYRLPANLEIGVASYAFNRSSLYWKEPDQFHPERFLNDPNQDMKSKFFPFSKGPYSCLGRELGLLSLHLIVANLFRRYNITLGSKGQTFASQQYLTLQPIETEVFN